MIRKRITIQNEKDYQHFFKKIVIYKSIFYFFTFFEVDGDFSNEVLDTTINALNLKNRRKRIEYLYDQACLMIGEKENGKNMCGFQNNQCYVQRKLKNGMCNGCCRKCFYQTSGDCPTKNLACMMFHCSEVRERHKVLQWEDFPFLKVLSFKNQYVLKNDYFSLREDVLKDLYCYTLTCSFFRIYYRIIKNSILLKKKLGD